ncbi:MAG: UbiA family prenyltransferase [Anaerolineae bacterium]|nr:UbiA family prenyltransferase [Anaerolineae bacterium]
MDANTVPLSQQLSGLIRLSRWKEYVPFVMPLTIIGALMAAPPHGVSLDLRLAAVTAANILAVAYAFMINDIEDAPDDARDPARAARNPISTGEIGVRIGYTASWLVAAAALVMYASGGPDVMGIGIVTLLLSHLYSWRRVRLKAWPVTDVVSHSLMLSGLLFLAGYFIYHNQPGIVWLVAASVTLMSVYGQLYNQLRDYDTDKAAGLFNTAIVLGENYTRWLMYGVVALAGLFLVGAIASGVFPLWLGVVALIGAPVSMLLRPKTDMRGSALVDKSGGMQIQALVIINMVALVWLGWAVLVQLTAL